MPQPPEQRIRATPRRGRPLVFHRDTVLDAAEEILRTHGLTGMTLESVAAAAGISVPTVYRHLGGREKIIGAVLDRASLRLPPVRPSGDPHRRPGAVAGHIFDVLDPQPWIVDIIRRGGRVGLRGLAYAEAFLAACDDLDLPEDVTVELYRNAWALTLARLVGPGADMTRPSPELVDRIRTAGDDHGLTRVQRMLHTPVPHRRTAVVKAVDDLVAMALLRHRGSSRWPTPPLPPNECTSAQVPLLRDSENQ